MSNKKFNKTYASLDRLKRNFLLTSEATKKHSWGKRILATPISINYRALGLLNSCCVNSNHYFS
jgi:hypothetical protein